MSKEVLKTIDEFAQRYTPIIKKYINFQNSRSSTPIDPDDFLQDFLAKCIKEKTLEKFDPTRAKFNTFLNRVLHNFYISIVEKRAREEMIFVDLLEVKDVENKDPVTPETDDCAIFETKEDLKLVSSLIEKIPKKEEKLLVKLKLYHPSMAFEKDELAYLAKYLGANEEKVAGTLGKRYLDKPGDSIGLRNKDIAKLLPYKEGSISTIFNRVVKKHIKDQYIIMRNY